MAISFYSKPVADLWFSRGSANSKGFGCKSIIWSNVPWKLHDNEKNWTRGRVSLAPLESTNAKSVRLWWRKSTCRTFHPPNQLLGTLMPFLDFHCLFWYYFLLQLGFLLKQCIFWGNAFGCACLHESRQRDSNILDLEQPKRLENTSTAVSCLYFLFSLFYLHCVEVCARISCCLLCCLDVIEMRCFCM